MSVRFEMWRVVRVSDCEDEDDLAWVRKPTSPLPDLLGIRIASLNMVTN